MHKPSGDISLTDGSYDATNPQSLNRYSYVLNNPLEMVDPSGLRASPPVPGQNDTYPDDECDIDGLDMPCGLAFTSDAYLPCPGNNCGALSQSYSGTYGGSFSLTAGANGYIWTNNLDGEELDDAGAEEAGLPLFNGSAGMYFGISGAGAAGGPGNGQLAFANGTPPIGTPRTSAQCSIYQDGSATGAALSKVCQAFPNDPKSNQIRGCLQSLYNPGSGYVPIPVIIPPGSPGGGTDLNSLLPGTGAHLGCFANAAGLL